MWNVHTRQICRDRSRLMFVRGLGEQMGVIGSDLKWVGRFNGSYLFFLWWAKSLRIRQWWWMYNPVNILFVVLYSLSNIFDPFGTRKHWVRAYKRWTLIFLYNLFILIGGQLLYNIVMVLPHIDMNSPRVYI